MRKVMNPRAVTPEQEGLSAELVEALGRNQEAVIEFVVRWAARKIAEEREACARLADSMYEAGWYDGPSPKSVAAAIRART